MAELVDLAMLVWGAAPASDLFLLAEPPEKKSNLQNMAYLFLFLLAVVFALRFLSARAKRERGEKAARGGPGSREESRVGAPGAPGGGARNPAGRDPEVSRLFIEMNEFAREMEGRMDTKIAYLRRLILDAEKVMGGLNQAIAEAEAVRRGEPRPEPPSPPSGALQASREEPRAPPVAPPVPALVDVTIGGGAGAGESGDPQAAAPDSIQSRILSLASAGKRREEIATAVGVPRGEVELVLSLHRASQKKTPSRD